MVPSLAYPVHGPYEVAETRCGVVSLGETKATRPSGAEAGWRDWDRQCDARPSVSAMSEIPRSPQQLADFQNQLAAILDDAVEVYADAGALLGEALRDPSSESETMKELVVVARTIGIPLIAACRNIEELTRLGELVADDEDHPRVVLGLCRVLGESMILMLGSSATEVASRPLIDPADARAIRNSEPVAAWISTRLPLASGSPHST